MNIIFGPVPSRRLGKSLGVNNIPPKTCSYSCVYCQLGRAAKMTSKRAAFYGPDEIFESARIKVEKTLSMGEKIDYITVVSDGEPTLDINLKAVILKLKTLGFPVAVITNSSMVFMEEIKEALSSADLVSLKVDAVDNRIWKKINRPHKDLDLDLILEGALKFSEIYKGELITETMLISGINDSGDHFEKLGGFLDRLKAKICYLSIPTRPPAESYAQVPSPEKLNACYQILSEKIKNGKIEYITGSEGNDFSFTGDVESDILGIVSVHPMREEALTQLLNKASAGRAVVERMMARGEITETVYKNEKFYLRKF